MRIGRLVVVGAFLIAGCSSSGGDAGEEPMAWDDGCALLRNLVVLVWADNAGLLPPEASLDVWSSENPDRAAFDAVGTASTIVDVGAIFANRSEEPDAWNDLLRYYENVGEPYLYSTDLEDIVALTPPIEPEADVVGWGVCAPTTLDSFEGEER